MNSNNIIPFRRKEEPTKNDNQTLIEELHVLHDKGDLEGIISFSDTPGRGTQMNISGSYANRLQLAVWSMIKGINELADRIAGSEEGMGHTPSPAVKSLFPGSKRRSVPRRLLEDTCVGELEELPPSQWRAR